MNKIAYPYSSSDKIEDRNTYFYSSYGGQAFLDAYFEMRLSVLGEQQARKAKFTGSKVPLGVTVNGVDTKALLRSLTGMLYENCMNPKSWELVAKLIQRFEVSKRIYPEYDVNWRPLDSSAYTSLNLYLDFATLMEAAYGCRAGLPELNALLKVVDSLISVRHLLTPEQKGQLAWLIQKEFEFVMALQGTLVSDHDA